MGVPLAHLVRLTFCKASFGIDILSFGHRFVAWTAENMCSSKEQRIEAPRLAALRRPEALVSGGSCDGMASPGVPKNQFRMQNGDNDNNLQLSALLVEEVHPAPPLPAMQIRLPSWSYDPPYPGFWDPVTSTINWCEEVCRPRCTSRRAAS